jgi:hypothetical protein
MKLNDTWRGALILLGLVVGLFVGAIALSDNGLQKLSCVGRAMTSGVAFSNINRVCGL